MRGAEAAAAEIADVTSANPTDVGPQISEPPELFVGFNETPSLDASQAIPDAPALPELTLPSIVGAISHVSQPSSCLSSDSLERSLRQQ